MRTSFGEGIVAEARPSKITLLRPVRVRLALLAVVFATATLAGPAKADWLSRLIALGEKTGSKAARHGGSALDNAAIHLKALPPNVKGPALVAEVGPEGHWTFANRAGERFTAGSPEELDRVAGVLAPEGAKGARGRLTIVLGEDTVLRQRTALKDLPKNADLRMASGGQNYALLRWGEGATEKLFAEVRPSLLVELGEQRAFREALWQLDRPLARADIRVLALDPKGPQTLSPAPKIDPATGQTLTDRIDPYQLPAALRSVGGQTVILTGRIEGRFLYFRPGSGSERGVMLQDLTAAAEAADVNLIVLQSATPRQPGSRNWLWQRMAVDGLDEARERATLADFINALGAAQGKLVVSVREVGQNRVSLTALPIAGESTPRSGVGSILTDIVADITGRVVTTAIEADLKSEARERELEQRIIPGIPSDIQFGYLGFLIIGLMGLTVARRWWLRVWPATQREEYGAAIGYQAARLIRLLMFVLVFLPLIGLPAFLWGLGLQVWSWLMLPVRGWRRLMERRSAQPG
ncbi:MAG TPA: hypothetical protein VNK52_07650 [Hyphomicrobiaceae bacterium]|nr:hypothetical protein [Hyphomicrobiaceae bacterium]